MKTVVFGGREREKLEIVVYGYEREASGEYWDDNWLLAEVNIQSGAFQGGYSLSLTAPEISGLHNELLQFSTQSNSEVSFTTLESQLELTLKSDSLGHIKIIGEASDQPGIGNLLKFTIEIDQTQLKSAVRELGAIVNEYPIRT